MKRIALSAAIAIATALPAQALWGDRVVNEFIDDAYEPSYVSVFAAAGGQTAIYGATRDGAGAEEIASRIRLPAFVSPRRITAGPTGERSGPHLVLVFAPQGIVTPKEACRGEAKGGVAGSKLKVLGVFCSSYNRPVTEATLIADDSVTPSDPGFQDTIGTLLRAIMPPRNPTFGGEGRIRRAN